MSSIDIDRLDGLEVGPPINRRRNRDCAVIMHEGRASGIPLGYERLQRLLRRLEACSDAHADPPEWRNAFSPKTRIAVLDGFRASTAEIARRELNREGGVLAYDAEADSDEP